MWVSNAFLNVPKEFAVSILACSLIQRYTVYVLIIYFKNLYLAPFSG